MGPEKVQGGLSGTLVPLYKHWEESLSPLSPPPPLFFLFSAMAEVGLGIRKLDVVDKLVTLSVNRHLNADLYQH
jgi:hypothetical protein